MFRFIRRKAGCALQRKNKRKSDTKEEKLKQFEAAHPCESMTVDGAHYRYILGGKENGKTLVFLNGGMDAETLKSLKKKSPAHGICSRPSARTFHFFFGA